jgi:hypothetical protein
MIALLLLTHERLPRCSATRYRCSVASPRLIPLRELPLDESRMSLGPGKLADLCAALNIAGAAESQGRRHACSGTPINVVVIAVIPHHDHAPLPLPSHTV